MKEGDFIGNTISKEDAIINWLMGSPLAFETPLIGYLRENEGSLCVRPVVGEAVLKNYVSAEKLMAYDFYVEMMMPLSITTDSVNSENMLTGRLWQEWIDEMEDAGSYPDFGERCVCLELKNMSNMPQMAQLYEGGTAKYQFPARLVYLDCGN